MRSRRRRKRGKKRGKKSRDREEGFVDKRRKKRVGGGRKGKK